jgi:hypothetical protein
MAILDEAVDQPVTEEVVNTEPAALLRQRRLI